MDQTSYLEQCIQALPPEKQAAARRAFQEFAEGDDSTFSRLLVVLEATGVFAKAIPKELAEVSNRLLADLDKRREQAEKSESDRAKQQEERLRGVLAQQVPALGKAMAVDKLVLTVDRQNATLSRIERAIERFRHLRVGGMLFLMFISAALAAGGVIASFWQDYHDGQNDRHFFTRLSRAGVELSIRRTADGSSVFVVQSSRLQRGTAWLKDDRDYIAGANFAIDEGGQ